MEKVLSEEFCEMSSDEIMMVEGGGFWSAISGISRFLVNRLVWTNAKNMYENFYVPIVPAGKDKIYSA